MQILHNANIKNNVGLPTMSLKKTLSVKLIKKTLPTMSVGFTQKTNEKPIKANSFVILFV